PVVRSPRAEASATYSVTRRDDVQTRVSVLRSDVSSGPCSPAVVGVTPGATCSPTAEVAEVTEAWRRRVTRTTEASIGAGASVIAARPAPEDPFVNRMFPTAAASIQYARAGRAPSVVRMSGQLAPFLDARTGIVDERAQAILEASLPLRLLLLSGTAAATHS